MSKIIFAVFFLFPLLSFSQNEEKEFEGMIKYVVTLEVLSPTIKREEIIKHFGKLRRFYFKEGNYKWEDVKSYIEFELYNVDISKDHYIVKNRASEELHYHSIRKHEYSVSNVVDLVEDTICGISCKGACFTVVDKDRGLVIIRSIYYPADSLLYAKQYYVQFTDFGNDSIEKYCGAIPLRMVMEFPNTIKVTYEATKIKYLKLSDDFFEVDENVPVSKER